MNTNYVIIDEDVLAHHGILGQKWGVRRYQNEDGSLTVAGKARYGYKEANGKAKREKAKEERLKATKQAVKEYNKAYDKASSEADKADAYWRETLAQRKKLGKTIVGRVVRSIKNDTAEAKKYNKMYDEAMKKFDTVDELWSEANKKYRDTGKNRVAAVLNNIKYS